MTRTGTSKTQQFSDVHFKRARFLMGNKEMAVQRDKWIEKQKLATEGLQRKHCYQGTTRFPLEQEVETAHSKTYSEFQKVS